MNILMQTLAILVNRPTISLPIIHAFIEEINLAVMLLCR